VTYTRTIRLKALWGLRIHGPCSISDPADRTGLDRQAVYNAVYKLRVDGLAEHLTRRRRRPGRRSPRTRPREINVATQRMQSTNRACSSSSGSSGVQAPQRSQAMVTAI
jgi:hypothetical protein